MYRGHSRGRGPIGGGARGYTPGRGPIGGGTVCETIPFASLGAALVECVEIVRRVSGVLSAALPLLAQEDP
eukprot:9325050-Pyramimonas_sp.AAC.1